MSHQQPVQEAPAVSAEQEASSPFIIDCHRVAIDRLGRSFEEARPLAILIGEGKSGTSFVIQKFLSGIKGDFALAQITEPCSNAIEMMRGIVNGIGFDPKDMNLTDLEQIFKMFLTFQQTHNRRTIICVEEAQDNGRWVLDRLRRFVESEIEGKFGLMVILSGRPGLNELLNEPPLDAMCGKAGKRIFLAPFSLAETKEYIRRRVEGAGAADISQVFTFNAITAIQELSAGVPDEVSKLCSKCLELADLEDSAPITTALVNRAARLLRLASMVQTSSAAAEEVANGVERSSKGQLIAYVNDTFAQEQTLNGGHVLIGRDELCDIRLPNSLVSRHHALVVNSSTGVKLVDLGSRNGTFVNDRKIRKHTLQDNDRITVGECSIDFVAGNGHHSWYFDPDPTASFKSNTADPALIRNGNGLETETLDSARKIISFRYHGARSENPSHKSS